MLRTAKRLSRHKISHRVNRLHTEQFHRERSGFQARAMRKILLLAILMVAIPCVAHGQTVINAKDCSATAFKNAWNQMVSGVYVINLPNCTAGTTGTYKVQDALTVPSGVTGVTIQGQTTVSCTGAAGTSSYACTYVANTVLTDSFPSSNNPIWTISGISVPFRITGIAFVGGAITASVGKPNGFITLGGSSTALRVDHCVFDTRPYDGSNIGAMFTMFSAFNGVADHNVAFLRGESNGIRLYPEANGFTAWSQPTNFGNSNWFFMESNVTNGGFINDCNQGGRMVLRYNSLSANANEGDTGGWQGHQTSQGTPSLLGCRALEVYHNYVSNPTPSTQQSSVGGGGQTGLAWGNTITAGYNYDLNFWLARSLSSNNCGGGAGNAGGCAAPPNGYGYCGSASSGVLSMWDGNSDSTGYPCLSAPGRGQGDLLSGSSFPNITNTTASCVPTSPPGCSVWPHQMLEPWYSWDESIVSGNIASYSNWNNNGPVANRDAYTQVSTSANTSPTSPFNGTTGTGFGPAANRPTFCTAGPGGTFGVSPTGSYGVAYFATDANSGNGELYVCTSTNTWTAIYTPYTYPHPLIAGGGVSGNAPTPPTGLVVTVQ